MKKSFILTLLTIITLGLFQPATALAEESQKLPSGIERDQIGQKSKTLSRNMKRQQPVWQQPFLTRMGLFTKAVLDI